MLSRDFGNVLAEQSILANRWLAEQRRKLPVPARKCDYRQFDQWLVEQAERMPTPVNARQYFNSTLSDSLIVPASAVSPGTTATFLLSQNQANKYFPLPYGQNAPSPGQIFHVSCGGLFTSVAGTFIFNVYHGPGTSATAGGTALGASQTLTSTAYTAGFYSLEAELIYRSISETPTTSTCWLNGCVVTGGPAANTTACLTFAVGTSAAVSVDTTGSGSAGTFGALNLFVTPGTTGSSFTTEYAYIYSLN